jgi:predicted DNA-binding transcriptional regulator AlpA
MEKRTLDIPEVARILGVSRNSAYVAARDGTLPVPVLRIGRRMVVPRRALEDLLGVQDLDRSKPHPAP